MAARTSSALYARFDIRGAPGDCGAHCSSSAARACRVTGLCRRPSTFIRCARTSDSAVCSMRSFSPLTSTRLPLKRRSTRWRTNSTPSMSGMFRSNRISAGAAARPSIHSKATLPLVHVLTRVNPRLASIEPSSLSMKGSSSSSRMPASVFCVTSVLPIGLGAATTFAPETNPGTRPPQPFRLRIAATGRQGFRAGRPGPPFRVARTAHPGRAHPPSAPRT